VLTISDVDDGEAKATVDAGQTSNGNYWVDENGEWSFVVDNTKIQHLGAGKTIIDNFTVTSQDGTATQEVAVTITGINDQAVFSGTDAGAVSEDRAKVTHGQLTVTDVDDGEAGFKTVSSDDLVGKFGHFSFDAASGEWGYTLDNDNAQVQALNADQTLSDTLKVYSLDGTAHEIQVGINGTDEVTAGSSNANSQSSQNGNTTADTATNYKINYGLNVVNGHYILKNFDSNDTLEGVGQIKYAKTFAQTDFGNDGVMDTVVQFTNKDGQLTEHFDVVLVGYTGPFNDAMVN